jgi:hypothetical protein
MSTPISIKIEIGEKTYERGGEMAGSVTDRRLNDFMGNMLKEISEAILIDLPQLQIDKKTAL